MSVGPVAEPFRCYHWKLPCHGADTIWIELYIQREYLTATVGKQNRIDSVRRRGRKTERTIAHDFDLHINM